MGILITLALSSFLFLTVFHKVSVVCEKLSIILCADLHGKTGLAFRL